MKAKIISILLPMVIEKIVGMLDDELLLKFADKGLDFIEDFIAGTETTIDDVTVLPVINLIRETFNIPDND